MEIIELKIITQVNNLLNGLNSSVEMTEDLNLKME